MAAEVRQSGLVKRLGNRLDQAMVKSAHREIKEKFQRLPGGITNGIARLTKCYIGEVAAGKANAGQLFWRAEGVVVSPEAVNVAGVRTVVRGMTTSIMGMLCDTGEGDKFHSLEDNVGTVLDEMRLLGATFSKSPTGTELETVCKALERAKPFFKFETRESPETKNQDGSVKYAARVWETWFGTRGLEEYDPNKDAAAGVTDGNSGGIPEPSANGDGQASHEEVDQDDLDALVAAAGGEDDSAAADAGERLIALAIEAGCDEDAAREADGWEDVKAMIEEARNAAAEPAEEPAPTAKPAPTPAPAKPKFSKGDVVLHHKLGADGKPEKGANKKVKPKVEWEITKVDAAKKCCDLLDNDTKKVKMAAVAFDALELPAY